jgi:PEP-CTERM motif
MKIFFRRIIPATVALLVLSGTARANLLVNGGFQISTNGYSEYLTPFGWSNIGPEDGIIADSVFGTPSYNGFTYYNDLGGYGDALPPSGAGIEQTVATTAGQGYSLTFGLSNENALGSGPEAMTLLLNGGTASVYPVAYNGSYAEFQLPWVTETFDFTATGASTTIAFTVTGTSLGDQDPLIAGADLETSSSVSTTPEPGTFITLGTGLVALAGRRFRRSKS